MRKLAGGHFFLLDLRNHHQRHLRLAETGGTRKAEHDMRALKRSDTDELRGGEPTGRKVIITWDKAGIDFTFWHTVKQTAGLYFISREKENVDNEGERKRKAKRRKEDEENGGNYISTALQRFTVRSLKCIRWLRVWFYREALWGNAVARLREIHASF
jgi:hypothetical protein